MPQDYVFEFPGTKADLVRALDSCLNSASYGGKKTYYFDDYIVAISDNSIHFGVERCGHSGGYWYIPSITEYDDHMELCGTIKYIGPDISSSPVIKVISEFLLLILLLPIAIIIWLYIFFEWMIRKLFRNPKPKEKIREEKLYDLMENHLGCRRKEI